MSYKKFDDIIDEALKQGKDPFGRTAARIHWFRKYVDEKLNRAGPTPILRDPSRGFVREFAPGNIILYEYDPKTKNKLPYWDRYPLVLPIKETNNGFVGLNFHYIDLKTRATLFFQLLKYHETVMPPDELAIILSPDLTKGYKYKGFKPCIKRYLFSKIKRKRMSVIEPREWLVALFAPLAKFEKADLEKVWSDSKNRY